MRILVVGGAGYIGSHAAAALARAGHEPRVLDNLSVGHRGAVAGGAPIVADLADRSAIASALRGSGAEAVMHFAASASVPESVADPAKYYRNNLVGTINLLDAMRAEGVGRLIFSSTAAVYGAAGPPITEESPREPVNPYGVTKLACERAMADYAAAYGLGAVALRYFNACGAAEDGSIGEDHDPETHLIPLVLRVAQGRRAAFSITGTDYPTPDGSCVRDFIHVDDLAEAHIRVLGGIAPGTFRAYNVGTGSGFSVREVVESARRVTGRPIPVVEAPRRPGDPAVLVASADALRRDTGWSPKHTDIDSIVASAWRWQSAHPDGYDDD